VSLRFDETKVKREAARPEPGCTIPRETLVREGTFRGRIKLDDRKGFGSLDLRQASGSITDFAAETCPARKCGAAKHGAAGAAKAEAAAEETGVLSRSLHAGRKLDGGQLDFDVETFPSRPFGKRSEPQFEFIASFDTMRHGLSTFASVVTPVATKGFDVIPGSEATAKPPAPFDGSATFKLESPTAATWSGDLSVEIPTLGKVDLTAPGTWASLCEGGSCTDTLPAGMRLSLLGSD
jgi:hypothetical protein